MPDLDQDTVSILQEKLKLYLTGFKGYVFEKYINAGGSAAIFKVSALDSSRVFKVFDPRCIDNSVNSASKRRLDIQRQLIGHDCPTLIQTFSVAEAEGTVFVEMEYNDWPQLSKVLKLVPDEKVHLLISQLVGAVKYLEDKGIVHRDIKPENIHVSNDFKNLKLLDLGVAREFECGGGLAETDQGKERPFLATAQYSSPEYLFRLTEPTQELWKGLNLYQVGAVLHDLIMKTPIFQEEIDSGNRWLLARSVLSKIPSFSEVDIGRMAELKSVAARCLVKDINTRLKIVSWGDFDVGPVDAVTALKMKLAGFQGGGENEIKRVSERLSFEREEFITALYEKIRTQIISVLDRKIAVTRRPGVQNGIALSFSLSDSATVECRIRFEWKENLYADYFDIHFCSMIVVTAMDDADFDSHQHILEARMHESENETASYVCQSIAKSISRALDLLSANPEDISVLNGRVLLGASWKEGA